MKLSTRSKEYIIPEYSLTGDLLSFLTCNLQYRYQNKGNLPPSMPIQLWFGEFIHGTLEEAFLKWKKYSKDDSLKFPWDWESEIHPIEELITKRLKVKGLNPPYEYIDNYGPKDNIYSARLERSINLWGPHLFPLIDDTEVLIKGLRPLKNENTRSDYYSINGVVDVLSSKKLERESQKTNNQSFQQTLDSFLNSSQKNILLDYLSKNEEFKKLFVNGLDEYEIIIDYKGMRRPSAPSKEEFSKIQSMMINGDINDSEEYLNYKAWIQQEWQILTYAWLRKNQQDSEKPVVGIIFYLNELVPSTDDLVAIRDDLKNNRTDISKEFVPKEDWLKLINWDEKLDLPIHRDLSDKFKMDRSIRIINLNDDLMKNSLKEFDKVVNDIESSLIKEMNGFSIKDSWEAKAEERTCNACDFRTFCTKKDNDKDSKNKPAFNIP
ncbi:PD-(D/E)XK nuclease superfamily protein [Methanobrevibacter olleyae]|uniref:PD-(D/E)XK nuclease superfamily protein n=1 Tax=Methanobrevibacter olleyae TaxID=294671 RepID=A0A1I4GL02_METOL|nr:PD-(D/E)XK nuclease family protein [Methanobrevibacter olleyae]SFL29786.1 PD-(D/E)XK nuclease superfamily protein [Methanobrevibacter olleyae]